MEVLRRTGLMFLMIALMASMVAVSALTGTAQNSGQYDAKQGGQYDSKDGSSGSDAKQGGQHAIYCSPQWFMEWHQAQSWWYFWWYNWCYDTGNNDWFKVYDGWEWWGPVS